MGWVRGLSGGSQGLAIDKNGNVCYNGGIGQFDLWYFGIWLLCGMAQRVCFGVLRYFLGCSARAVFFCEIFGTSAGRGLAFGAGSATGREGESRLKR